MGEQETRDFVPSYVWPNPAFFFRVYYDSPKCRIFLIENIVHNWKWLSKYASRFQERDFFFVQLGWYFGDYLVEECHRALTALGLDKRKFRIMFPDYQTKTLFEYYGFRGEIVNHNCFLDERKFAVRTVPKVYDAVYVARLRPFKRHYLAAKVGSLALVAGDSWGGEMTEELPPHDYLNESPLDSDGVISRISESHVGLCLSQFEGACYSSSEYLLCGVPVVSTWSHGGRDLWYNDYNSITCDEDADSVASAVEKLKTLDRNPDKIRSLHIGLANQLRNNFIFMHQQTLAECGVSDDARAFFEKGFRHKLSTSQTPNFEEIFP